MVVLGLDAACRCTRGSATRTCPSASALSNPRNDLYACPMSDFEGDDGPRYDSARLYRWPGARDGEAVIRHVRAGVPAALKAAGAAA
jgi:hypothetical protein